MEDEVFDKNNDCYKQQNLSSESDSSDSDFNISFEDNSSDFSSASSKNTEKTAVEINCAYGSHKRCVICKSARKNRKILRIPNKAILNCYLTTNIMIPFGCRACSHHFDEYKMLNNESVSNLKYVKRDIHLSPKELKLLIEFLRLSSIKSSIFDKFEVLSTLSNDFCYQITGLYLIHLKINE